MLIDIPQRLIDDAQPGACTLCPLARRLEELTGTTWFVSEVDVVPLVRLMDPTYTHRLLPPEATAWIRALDAGERVAPFSFELELEEFLPVGK